MTSENESNESQSQSSEEPKLKVPEPPAPVDVGGWSISTESADDQPESGTFLTEDTGSKN